MRYMGYLGDPLELENALSQTSIDPTVKAGMLAQAASLPDPKAQDLIDIADATPLGKRTKLVRIGMGIATGIVLGLIVAAVRRKR